MPSYLLVPASLDDQKFPVLILEYLLAEQPS